MEEQRKLKRMKFSRKTLFVWKEQVANSGQSLLMSLAILNLLTNHERTAAILSFSIFVTVQGFVRIVLSESLLANLNESIGIKEYLWAVLLLLMLSASTFLKYGTSLFFGSSLLLYFALSIISELYRALAIKFQLNAYLFVNTLNSILIVFSILFSWSFIFLLYLSSLNVCLSLVVIQLQKKLFCTKSRTSLSNLESVGVKIRIKVLDYLVTSIPLLILPFILEIRFGDAILSNYKSLMTFVSAVSWLISLYTTLYIVNGFSNVFQYLLSASIPTIGILITLYTKFFTGSIVDKILNVDFETILIPAMIIFIQQAFHLIHQFRIIDLYKANLGNIVINTKLKLAVPLLLSFNVLSKDAALLKIAASLALYSSLLALSLSFYVQKRKIHVL